MTTPITKEQLQRIIESVDDVLSAQAGTNEDVHPESDDMIHLWDYLNDVAAPPAVVKRLAEIALESLEAEPVGTFRKGPCGYSPSFHEDAVPLYATPPAPVVDVEPVADVVAWHKEGEERTCDIRWRRFDVAPGPLFAVAQPVAVVPGELDYQGAKELFNYLMTEEETIATVNGWNAFRAAMIQANNIN